METRSQKERALAEVAYQSSVGFSVLGNSIAAVILPLLVLQSTESVLSAGIVALATGIPQFIAAAIGGVVLDRFDRRKIAIAGDGISAVAVALLAVVHLTVGLNLKWFIVFGILSAIGDVPALTAREALVPALSKAIGASKQRIVATREALSAVATLIGPALAAVLLLIFAPATALWITAATSLLAAAFVVGIPQNTGTADATSEPGIAGLRNFASGVCYLWNRPTLRAATFIGLVLAVITASVQGIALPAYFTSIGEPALTGWTLSVLAVGMMFGAGLYAALNHVLGIRNTMLVGGTSAVHGAWILAALPQYGVVIIAVALLGIGVGCCSALTGVLTLEYSSSAFQGRVLGNQNALTMGVSPLATLLIAIVITNNGMSTALVGAAIILTATVVWSTANRNLSTISTHEARPNPEFHDNHGIEVPDEAQ